MWAAG